jgi:hypothetical protein
MKTLLIATALAGLVSSAHAAERVTLGEEVIGTWCYGDKSNDGVWRYRREVNPPKNRAPCKGVEWMEIKQNGYDGPEFSCKTVESKVISSGSPATYSISYRCNGEGYAWKETCVLGRGKVGPRQDLLFVECAKLKGK